MRHTADAGGGMKRNDVKRGLEDGETMERVKRPSVGQNFGSGDDSALSLKILVSNKCVGGVIGKGGATINGIKETSGARVKVSNNAEVFPGTTDRIIVISGALNSVLTASRLVVSEIFKDAPKDNPEPSFTEATASIVIVIPAVACGLIIGKGGERINLLREQTQAKIQLQSKEKAVPGLNERTVTISGSLLNVQMALEKITLALFDDGTVHYENQGTNYAGFGQIQVNHPRSGGGGGGGGAMSQNLPSSVGGLSFLPASHLHHAALQLPIGYEFAAHAAAAAYGLQQTPQQHFPSMESGGGQVQLRLAIPEASVGVLVGKAGNVIKELMNLSGASIKVSQKGEVVPGTTNRIVTISGNPVASNYAHMLVLQKVPTATPIQ